MRAMLLLLVLGLAGCSAQADPPPPLREAARFALVSEDPVKHGERLSKVLGCVGCHGDSLKGKDWSDDKGTLWTANLTQSGRRFSHDQLAAMITQGKRSDRPLYEMPSYLFSGLNPDDVLALIAYLKTLKPEGAVHPEPSLGPELLAMQAKGEWMDSAALVADMQAKGPPDLGAAFAYGRFIVRATCVECHGIELEGNAGPMEEDGNPPPNLRIVGSYSPGDFARLMTTGKAAGNREAGLMSEVARRRYASFTPDEREAVYGYLAELARRNP